MAKKPAPKALGPDGLAYSAKQQHDLDETIAATFAVGAGKQALAYLRSITVNTVCGPEASDAKLRHMEGARWLVGVIEERLAAGIRQRQASKGESDEYR